MHSEKQFFPINFTEFEIPSSIFDNDEHPLKELFVLMVNNKKKIISFSFLFSSIKFKCASVRLMFEQP